MKIRGFTFLAAAVAMLLGLAACAPKEEAVALLPMSGPAPAWQLKDVDGKLVSSEQFKGKVVVVDFWATWCGPCRTEIPGYIALQKKYAKDGLVIIGISVDEAGPAVVKEFIAQHGLNYQVVMAEPATSDAFGGVDLYPTTFIIDRNGQMRARKLGAEPTSDFEKQLLPFLTAQK